MGASRRWVRLVTSSVALAALVVVDASGGDVAAAAPVAAPAAAPARAQTGEAVDLVSARVAARAQGHRVEALGERTDTTTTWVNPDGSLTTEVSGAPVRFKDPAGRWQPVDLDLKTAGTDVVPVSSDLGVRLSAGGAAGGDVASVDHGAGRGVSWALGGGLGAVKLPAPVLAGRVATYPNVLPGVDVRVSVRPSGFEQDFVIKDRAAADQLAGITVSGGGAGAGSFSIPLKTRGLTAKASADGGVAFVDGKGKQVSVVPPAAAWDARLDPRSGDPASVSPVKLSVAQSSPGQAVLTVTPDAAWLADPARVFPVTIDPVYASMTVTPSFDTWVENTYTTDQSASTELKVGTFDAGSSVARSYLNFPTTGFRNLKVESAQLSVYETWSYSCTARAMNVFSSSGASTSTRWTSQPSVGATVWGSVTTAKGFSSTCAAGWVQVPLTSLFQTLSTSTGTSSTVLLKAASETDSAGWKKFSSMEGANPPKFTVTYDRKPNAAATPDLGGTTDGANSYTIPGTGTVQLFTSDSTPRLHSTATDPDGNQVAVTFEVHNSTAVSGTSLVASCSTGWGPSGTAGVSCSPTTALAENSTYYVRAAVKDDQGVWNGTWSPWRTFYTQWSTPPTPRVSCDNGYANGTWTDADPAGTVTCAITAAGVSGTYSAPGYLDVTVDGVKQSRLAITATNDWAVVHKTYTFPATAKGYHEIKVTGISRALKSSAQASYGFGWGAASMSTPTSGTASSGKVKVAAGGPPKGSATAVTAKVQWRVAGSGNEATGWTDSSAAAVSVTPTSTSAPAAYTGVFDLSTATREAGALADVPSRTPVRLDVQVCFTYTGGTGGSSSVQCTWSQSPATVTRLPHAFGAGYPTSDAAGAGQVALYTGELAADATDVSVPGYGGAITLSRSHTSFAGNGTAADWPADPATGVFGPGWTANLEGNQAGLAGLQVIDSIGVDGSIAFVDGQGNPLVYANSGGTRTYPTGTQTYVPATDDTLAAAIRLTTTGTGTGTRLSLTEQDGTTTTWKPRAAPSTAGTTWQPDTISEPGQSGTTTFGDTNNDGRIDRVVAPVPAGMTGTCPTSGALSRGCRAIDITYATATTATSTTPGDHAGQVKTVSAWLWDPAANSNAGAMATTGVATYSYDTLGRLVTVRDPRTGIGTDYTWGTASAETRIASVRQATPASTTLAATKLAYDTAGKLTQVTRENPAAGQPDVTVARYVYAVPTSGTGLPDLSDSATGVDAWYQAKAPVTGYAVFGQDYTGTVAGSGTSWPGVDWTYADLSYVDDLGYTVNTAAYGAGAWQVTSTDYDTSAGAGAGNTVRTLDASAVADVEAKAGTPDALDAAGVDAMSTQTVYNTEIKDATSGAVTLPRGSRVTDTYGPTREVVLADGTTVPARPHTHTDYDQGA
ncbi:MAG TPA: DNRLRE domain-containing protein, partial [Intrasporangium sp.]|uniref:DNRLRE domain-containing protein n=1 Tax=Intrasporangium sp. TaxID=1925024 RepID=UPI002D765271